MRTLRSVGMLFSVTVHTNLARERTAAYLAGVDAARTAKTNRDPHGHLGLVEQVPPRSRDAFIAGYNAEWEEIYG